MTLTHLGNVRFPLLATLGLLFSASVLTGCETNYKPYSSMTQTGYSDVELQPNVFNVRFNGNEFTTPERASELSMLRASELCISRGQSYMKVSNRVTEQRVTGYSPATTTTTVDLGEDEYGAYGSIDTTETPESITYSPESGLTVECLAQKEANTWETRPLAQSLRAKYKVK